MLASGPLESLSAWTIGVALFSQIVGADGVLMGAALQQYRHPFSSAAVLSAGKSSPGLAA
jgi:hypothetical protein